MKREFLKRLIKENSLQDKLEKIVEQCKDKKVLLVSNLEVFMLLDKNYKISDKINITSLIIEKVKYRKRIFNNKFPIYDKLSHDDNNYDLIVCLNIENIKYLEYISQVKSHYKIKIINLFDEKETEKLDHRVFIDDLNFPKTFNKTISMLKNKKVVLYGAGSFFDEVRKLCDISKINIIAVADKKYAYEDIKEYLGFKTITPEKIIQYEPDYVLVATKKTINVIQDLQDLLSHSKTKIATIPKRGIIRSFKDILEVI